MTEKQKKIPPIRIGVYEDEVIVIGGPKDSFEIVPLKGKAPVDFVLLEPDRLIQVEKLK